MPILLIIVALFERLILDFGPNIELVTTACILTGLYLKPKQSLIVPLTIMAISDAVLGFCVISIFTWSAFVITAFLPKIWSKLFSSPLFSGTMAGIMGNLIFYLWTNFGVWLTDRWGMYPNDLSGLLLSYINGLPFLKLNLLSTIMFLPASIVLFQVIILKKTRVSLALFQVKFFNH